MCRFRTTPSAVFVVGANPRLSLGAGSRRGDSFRFDVGVRGLHNVYVPLYYINLRHTFPPIQLTSQMGEQRHVYYTTFCTTLKQKQNPLNRAKHSLGDLISLSRKQMLIGTHLQVRSIVWKTLYPILDTNTSNRFFCMTPFSEIYSSEFYSASENALYFSSVYIVSHFLFPLRRDYFFSVYPRLHHTDPLILFVAPNWHRT